MIRVFWKDGKRMVGFVCDSCGTTGAEGAIAHDGTQHAVPPADWRRVVRRRAGLVTGEKLYCARCTAQIRRQICPG